MNIEVQDTVYSIIAVSAVIAILIFVVHGQLKKFDPLSEPKGLVLLMMMFVSFIDGMLKEETTDELTDRLGPYMGVTALYIFLCNISGLFSISFSVCIRHPLSRDRGDCSKHMPRSACHLLSEQTLHRAFYPM